MDGSVLRRNTEKALHSALKYPIYFTSKKMDAATFVFDRVMIVDDTKIDRYIAATVMNKHGFSREIIEFDMATKAISYLEQYQKEPSMLPQVTVLDVRMPEMDGFQFLERLSLLPAMA